MALPYLIKHIYNSGSEEVIRHGKRIYSTHEIEVASRDELMGSISFRVKDDTYGNYYKVYIDKYDDPRELHLRCTCPYNISSMCRHKVAALLQLQDLIDKNLIGNFSSAKHDQRHTVAKMRDINLKIIRMIAGYDNYEKAKELLRYKKCDILSAGNDLVKAELEEGGTVYQIMIEKNDSQYFDTSCTCTDWDNVLCRHKTVLFLQLLNNFGAAYFDSIKNWDRQKNKLLARYGYSLTDDWQDKFEFLYKDGKPFLKVLDREATHPVEVSGQNSERSASHHETETVETEQVSVLAEEEETTDQTCLLIDANEAQYPYLSFNLITGRYSDNEKKFVGPVKKVDLMRPPKQTGNRLQEDRLIAFAKKLQQAEINKYLNRNSPFSGLWDNIITEKNAEYPEETRMLIAEFLHPKLAYPFQEDNRFLTFYLPRGKKMTNGNLREIFTSSIRPHLSFEVEKEKDAVVLHSLINIESQTLPLADNEWNSNFLPLFDDTLYQWERYEDCLIADKFHNPIHFPNEKWPEMLKKVVIPLTRDYPVEFDRSLIYEVKGGDPVVTLRLSEKGEYLLFQPVFTYEGYTMKPEDKETTAVAEGGKVFLIHRNPTAENEFIHTIRHQHSSFVEEPHQQALALKGADVLKDNWFFLFVDFMKERKIPVSGFEALKNFKFNTSRPTTDIKLSSGMDWFDAKVNITFGDQYISIRDIKNALSNKQSYVQLGDGTLGILPEEWIKKYSLLFKVGEARHGALRLSKYHLSVIDDLYEQRERTDVSLELDERLERIRNLKDIPEIDAPEGLQLQLRPYQLAGFRWLNYLREIGWGGILADDMGLGKTAQAISMILHLKKELGGVHTLVVCPTTLIYNWENEIKKFAPDLTFLIHHGTTRTKESADFRKHNIIITTYGTLRSDIQIFMNTTFNYVVLDESQAIKNPFSKVTKAACLLKTEHRICMSGTPLQNNTFDLYAQMNFLNPGLLGSVEFFRNEFSNPIDKLGEDAPKEQLRKILYPFILRRTKEQVAKDLPLKTEMVLYCEMEDQQRQIYESYRRAYRSRILGNIEEKGMGNSRLTILQGLMKLRQICDSPSILNEEDDYPNVSIKLEELARELNENIGQHKALVFSQFLGMLALIRNQLEKDGIKYEYFDGSTPAHERAKAVENFQSDVDTRVFVISLKAGGVGLNLTAADYVYIVDPWWNPAVEQQAIDRTHRIGQTKNIFAYRMICKNTIEDKILKLQERKRNLAKDLIADDSTFIKNLTKEDIEYLFS